MLQPHTIALTSKMDRKMTTTFKKIREKYLVENDGKIESIHKLDNALLNMQHMSISKAIYSVLSFPLYSTSRKTIFINIGLVNKRRYVLKNTKLLQREPNDSKNIVFISLIIKYIARSIQLEHIRLDRYGSYYTCSNYCLIKWMHDATIWYVWYNQHKDLEKKIRE